MIHYFSGRVSLPATDIQVEKLIECGKIPSRTFRFYRHDFDNLIFNLNCSTGSCYGTKGKTAEDFDTLICYQNNLEKAIQ